MRFIPSGLCHIFTLACLGSLGCLADELPGGKAGARPRAMSCAAFGAGFVGLAGSDTCVRIGGHVRVEYGWGAGAARGSNYGAALQDRPALFGDPGVAAAAPQLPFARLRPDGMAGTRASRH